MLNLLLKRKFCYTFSVICIIAFFCNSCDGIKTYHPQKRILVIESNYDLSFSYSGDPLRQWRYEGILNRSLEGLGVMNNRAASFNVQIQTDGFGEEIFQLYIIMASFFSISSALLLPFTSTNLVKFKYSIFNKKSEILSYEYNYPITSTIFLPMILDFNQSEKEKTLFKYSLQEFLSDIENDPKFIEFYKRSQEGKKR